MCLNQLVGSLHTTNTRTSLLKLNQPLQKNTHGPKSLFYVALSIWNKFWNKLPDFLKTTKNFNTYKQEFFS